LTLSRDSLIDAILLWPLRLQGWGSDWELANVEVKHLKSGVEWEAGAGASLWVKKSQWKEIPLKDKVKVTKGASDKPEPWPLSSSQTLNQKTSESSPVPLKNAGPKKAVISDPKGGNSGPEGGKSATTKNPAAGKDITATSMPCIRRPILIQLLL
jgi:hypothetical protein